MSAAFLHTTQFQLQLRHPSYRPFHLIPRPHIKSVLLSQPPNAFRDFLPIFFRRIGILRIPLPVFFDQARKFLLQERHEHFRRRRRQKQDSRGKPLRPSFVRRCSHSLQISFSIGNPRQKRRRKHPTRNPRRPQFFKRRKSQRWLRRTRLQ